MKIFHLTSTKGVGIQFFFVTSQRYCNKPGGDNMLSTRRKPMPQLAKPPNAKL